MITMSMVDVQMVSPSRKRPAPDDDISSSSTPAKMSKSSPVSTSSTPATSPKKTAVNTPARSVTLSVLSSPAGTLSPPPPLDFLASKPSLAVTSSTSAATKTSPKKKRTKEEIEAEKKIREAEKEAKRIAAEEKKRQREVEAEEKKRQREAEADEKKRQKEAKEAELEEKRRRKAEEDLVKNEEKKKKAEEREEKQRERDLKQHAKELEKQRKIEEQLKKEKAQPKLSNFFSKPAVSPSPQKKPVTEYHGFFLPFNLATHASLPQGWDEKFKSDHEEVDWNNGPTVDKLLLCLPEGDAKQEKSIKSSKFLPSTPTTSLPVGDIVDMFHGATDNEEQQRALALLDSVPWRYIHFHEDVRPAYWGTWSKRLTDEQKRKLLRNPRYKLQDIFDYDYDSEAEWEEPEEGEELNSDDEEEEEDGDDDMDDFLDDEEAGSAAKRGLFSTDLVPVNSGLRWEDSKGDLYPIEGEESSDFSQYTMEFLLGDNVTSIDPFSTEYWAPLESSKGTAKAKAKAVATATTSTRPALLDKTKQINGVTSNPTNTLKPARLVPAEDLDNFKQAIDGQDLTKIAMVEHLKKLFPQLPKDAIVNSLAQVAEREGKKASAKWRLKAV